MSLRQKHNKQLFVNIVVVSLLTTIISIAVFILYVSEREQDIMQGNIFQVEQSIAVVDSVVSDMINDALFMYRSELIGKDIIFSDYDREHVVTELKNLLASNRSYENVAIIPLKHGSYSYSSLGEYNTDYFVSEFFSDVIGDTEEPTDFLLKGSDDVLSFYVIDNFSSTPNTIILSKVLLPVQSSSPNMAAMFMLNFNTISELVNPITKSSNANFFLYDNGELIFSTEQNEEMELMPNVPYNTLTDELGFSSDNSVYMMRSDVSRNITYAWLFDNEVFYGDVRELYVGFFMLIVLFEVACIFVASMLLRLNFASIERYLSLLSNSKVNKRKQENIFLLLEEHYHKGLREELTHSQFYIIRQYVVKDIVFNGGEAFNNMQHPSTFLSDFLVHNNYCVLLIELCDYSILGKHSSRDNYYIYYGINNIIEELTREENCVIITQDREFEDRILALLSFGDSGVGFEQTISRLYHSYCEVIKRVYDLNINVGVSRPTQEIVELATRYEQAHKSLQYTFLSKEERILFYNEDIERFEQNSETMSIPLSELNRLETVLVKCDEEEAKKIIYTVLENEKLSQLGINYVNTYVSSVTSHIMNICLKLATERAFWELETKIREISHRRYSLKKELIQELITVVSELCRMTSSLKSEHADELYEDILSFVEENLCDNMLSLNLIADRFDLNPSYITTFFKQTSGVSLMRHVNSTRMELVEKRLVSEEGTIKEIVESCGFVDYSNFNRKFRAQHNMTAAQYREKYISQ